MKQTSAFAACLMALSMNAHGAHVVLTKIADDATPKPDGGTFVGVIDEVSPTAPVILESTIAFQYGAGIYTFIHGVFTEALDPALFPYLPVAGNFEVAPIHVTGDGQIAFLTRRANNDYAVYASDAGGVRPLVDSTFVLPGTTNRLRQITWFSVNGTDIAVSCWGYVDSTGGVTTSDADGVYVISGTNAQRVIDRNTPVPGAPGVAFVNASHVSYGDDRLSVLALMNNTGSALFTLKSNALTKITGSGDTIPGGGTTFIGFPYVSDRKGSLAFLGQVSTLKGSIYSYYDEALTSIVVQGQPLPDSGGNLDVIGAVAFDGGNVAFDCFKTQPTHHDIAIYASVGGQLVTVLSPATKTLGGHTIERIILGEQGMSGNSVVFGIVFTDHSTAIYRADLVFDEPIPTAGDYDGNGEEDTAIYDPETSTWSSREAKSNFKTRKFGFAGVQPVAADYDADGTTDIAVYDPNYGTWYILASHEGFHIEQFGYYGAQPAPKDYDGDGRCDLGVYDERTGEWFILKTTEGFQHLQFGFNGATPIPADFDNDGKVDIAVYEHARGNWYILASTAGFNVTQFGYYGVTPVPVDFDGGGADFAVFDPRNGQWYSHGQVVGFQLRQFGYSGVRPVSADYDGDAKSDLGVYDPHNGTWYLLRSEAGFRSGGL